jgi:hypothetical protein
MPFAIPANAQAEQRETHIPWRVQVIKNRDGDFLISLNRISSPAFLILIKRKLPSLTAHIIINEDIIILPRFILLES